MSAKCQKATFASQQIGPLLKTYYVEEGFETVTSSCPVPIVMAGGKKLAELDALTMTYNAVQQGAAGVDMIDAVGAVLRKSMKPKEAMDVFNSMKAKG